MQSNQGYANLLLIDSKQAVLNQLFIYESSSILKPIELLVIQLGLSPEAQ